MLFRGLPLLIELGLTIFCLIDCVQSPEGAIRNLSKGWWLLIILFFPIVGGIAWLVAGRPARDSYTPYVSGFPEHQRAAVRRGPVAPDDDPEFLSELGKVNTEHERTLKQWERDLARREQELRRRDEGRDTDDR